MVRSTHAGSASSAYNQNAFKHFRKAANPSSKPIIDGAALPPGVRGEVKVAKLREIKVQVPPNGRIRVGAKLSTDPNAALVLRNLDPIHTITSRLYFDANGQINIVPNQGIKVTRAGSPRPKQASAAAPEKRRQSALPRHQAATSQTASTQVKPNLQPVKPAAERRVPARARSPELQPAPRQGSAPPHNSERDQQAPVAPKQRPKQSIKQPIRQSPHRAQPERPIRAAQAVAAQQRGARPSQVQAVRATVRPAAHPEVEVPTSNAPAPRPSQWRKAVDSQLKVMGVHLPTFNKTHFYCARSPTTVLGRVRNMFRFRIRSAAVGHAVDTHQQLTLAVSGMRLFDNLGGNSPKYTRQAWQTLNHTKAMKLEKREPNSKFKQHLLERIVQKFTESDLLQIDKNARDTPIKQLVIVNLHKDCDELVTLKIGTQVTINDLLAATAYSNRNK